METRTKDNLITGAIVILMAIASMIGVYSAKADNFKAPTRETVVYTDTVTNHTYEIKDVKYPIFKSKKGAFYIWKTSKKTGKKYKYYLPKKVQEQIKLTIK